MQSAVDFVNRSSVARRLYTAGKKRENVLEN